MPGIRVRGCLLALLVAAAPAFAGPTVEQVQRVMAERSVPNWRKAAADMSGLRAKPPNEAFAAKWAGLDAETDASTGKAPPTRVTNPVDDNELWQYATWLRWRILTQNADGRYSYAYALNLSYMRNSDGDFLKEAAVFLFHARIVMTIDGARCADPSSPDAVITRFEMQKTVYEVTKKLEALPSKDRGVALLEAVSIEEMRGERPPAAWLCKQGSRAMMEALRQGGGFEQRKPAADPPGGAHIGGLGTVYEIDVSKVEPEFVADDVWRKRRRDTLDRNIKTGVERLQ